MSVVGVADTHTLIWYLYADPRLSHTARSLIDAAAMSGDQIGISAITLIEMVYPIEMGRSAVESVTRLAAVLEERNGLFVAIGPDVWVARALARVDVGAVPDMPDRIIAATALYLEVPVISKDRRIRLSGLTTVW